jgi:hypothetical protein
MLASHRLTGLKNNWLTGFSNNAMASAESFPVALPPKESDACRVAGSRLIPFKHADDFLLVHLDEIIRHRKFPGHKPDAAVDTLILTGERYYLDHGFARLGDDEGFALCRIAG